MGTSQDESDGRQVPPKRITSTVIIFLSIADTTWRLFVPSIGLTLLGVYLDEMWRTSPWLMVLGITVGVLLAILLVRIQMRKVELL